MNFKQKILDVISVLDEMNEESDELRIRLSLLDRKREDLLHCVEGVTDVKINPMKIYSELQSVSKERRKVKDNMEAYSLLLSSNKHNLAVNKKRSDLKHALDGVPKKYNMKVYSRGFKELLDTNQNESEEN